MAISPFRNLEADLEAAGAHGTVSLWWGDLLGVRFARQADVPHFAAGTMALPVVAAVMRKAQRGQLNIAQPIEIRNRFSSVADGSAYSIDPDQDDDPATCSTCAISSSPTRSNNRLIASLPE